VRRKLSLGLGPPLAAGWQRSRKTRLVFLRTTPMLTEPQHGKKYRNSHGRQQPIQSQGYEIVSFSKSDHVAYDQKQGALDPTGRDPLVRRGQLSRPTANLTAFREALRFCHRPSSLSLSRALRNC